LGRPCQYEDSFELYVPPNNSDTPSTAIAFSSTAIKEYSQKQPLLPTAVSSDKNDYQEGSSLYEEDHGQVHTIPL